MEKGEEEKEAEEQDLYNILVTRAATYHINKNLVEVTSSSPNEISKKSKRNATFIKCKAHNPQSKKNDKWKHENSLCSSCILFSPSEHLPNGVLPTRRAILENLMTLRTDISQRNKENASPSWILSRDIVLHWIFCNLYPKTPNAVQFIVDSLWKDYEYLKHHDNKKKKETYWNRYNLFLNTLNLVPDFLETNETRRKRQEKIWDCKTNDNDRLFHEHQLQNPPTGYCSSFVDKKWQKTQNRKTARLDRSRNEQSDFNVTLDLNDDEVTDYECEVELEWKETPTKKRKYKYEPNVSKSNESDDMPERFQHIRHGLRSVRPEIYALILKLKSKFHMSQHQAEAAIVETGNELFGREWKYYDPDVRIDDNTLPAKTNTNRVEPYFEAMILSSIVEEVMSGSKVVMYANDGSAMSGVGNYVVQSVTIDGVQRPLPTLSIFTETRESLEELEIMTLRILTASVAYKYTEKDLLERIDFVMTDSTSHNLEVMENVCERHGVEPPKSLLCNVHPLMMFQRKVKEIFQLLHDTLGKDKIVECFLVDVDFANEDFITKAIKCLTSFISKDYSAKPWNRQKHFDSFIAPKENETVSYKDHRFNRLFQCCMVLVHHIDDIASYLDTFRNIVNGISILDRSFVEMTLLKPVFCAVSLIGIHITMPFQALLLTKETNYSSLLTAFPSLYEELTSINPESLCTTTNQVFHFVQPDTFKNVVKHLKPSIVESIENSVKLYKSQVINLLRLILPKLADGFSIQRGKVFGFGPHALEQPKTFKISNASEEELMKLNKTSTHNLHSERSVGSINYEISVRGKGHLESSSKKLVFNKSFDLVDQPECLSKYQSYRQASKDIKLLKVEWNEKLKKMEEIGNLKKDTANTTMESKKYKDLEFLKQYDGPFTTAEGVKAYHNSVPESTEKNKRLKVEVRYAKNTSLSLKHTASVFKLEKNHKNLTSNQYVENLCQYLSDARSKTVLTADDLSFALTSLIGQNQSESTLPNAQQSDINLISRYSESTNAESAESTAPISPDEHIVAVWLDENKGSLDWFLGVVDSSNSEMVHVTYYHRKDKNGYLWNLPDDFNDPVPTPFNQLISQNLTVGYVQGTVLRCSLNKDTVLKIASAFKEYQKNN